MHITSLYKVMTLTSSEREDSLSALLPAPSWEAGIEAESYQTGLGSWESDKAQLRFERLSSTYRNKCGVRGFLLGRVVGGLVNY